MVWAQRGSKARGRSSQTPSRRLYQAVYIPPPPTSFGLVSPLPSLSSLSSNPPRSCCRHRAVFPNSIERAAVSLPPNWVVVRCSAVSVCPHLPHPPLSLSISHLVFISVILSSTPKGCHVAKHSQCQCAQTSCGHLSVRLRTADCLAGCWGSRKTSRCTCRCHGRRMSMTRSSPRT